VPVGLRLYLKEKDAEALDVDYHSRSELARQILDPICAVAAEAQRAVIATGDGNYSTKEFLQDLPENVGVVGRFPVNSRLYEAPPTERPPGRPGPMPRKGPEVGSPQTLAEEESSFGPHPTEEGAEVRVVCGIWDSVLPGVMLRVVVVRRLEVDEQSQKNELEAFFTTLGPTENESTEDESEPPGDEPGEGLSGTEILQEYSRRWSVEILIREAKQFGGLGKDRCRKLRRIRGVNAFRLFMLAATRLCFAKQVQKQGAVNLKSRRPWYKQKEVPSGRDVLWACRAHLLTEGITPTVGFEQAMGEFHRKQPATRSRAA